jgi:eukaryotic-like serine/threonine-protein kinase
MGSKRAILEMLASIADGETPHVDVARLGGPAARRLRIIGGIADVHRSLTDTDDASEPDVPSWLARTVPWSAVPPAPPPRKWGSLELRAKLGEGGFGEVFDAYDPQLERSVALKLLKSRATPSHDAANRLLAEARSLARIEHEHVVRVYGAEMHDGRVGLWMELVHGSTLESLLRERGVWGAREAAVAGQDLCRALAAVHQAGIVHGDVKAQNVVREQGGRLVLMDFGAGRPVDSPAGPRAGTPLYLAPEILAGSPPSVAGDIYSLGVLLYHLVTARFPFTATSLSSLKSQHREGQIERLHDVRPDLPDGFVRVIERALAPDAQQRFRSAGEMQAALAHVLGTPEASQPQARQAGGRWRWLAAALLGALALAAAVIYLRPTPPTPTDSVAVLPFRHIGAENDRYLTEGIADEIAARLSEIATPVRVVSSASARRFRNTDQPLADIGRELGAATLVAGSVQVAGDRLVIVAELLGSATSTQLWARTFRRSRQEAFELHTEVASGIASALGGDSGERAGNGTQRVTMTPEAFDLYLKGRFHWNQRTKDGLERSIEFFDRAGRADAGSALPWAGLASAHALLAIYRIEWPDKAYPRAEAAALRAIALEPTVAEAHAALGLVRMHQHRWQEADASLQRAIQVNTGYASAHHWLAILRAQQGRFDDAREEITKARRLDPLSLVLVNAAGYIELTARSFEAAIGHYKHVLELDPTNLYAQVGLVETYVARGEARTAIAMIDDAKRVRGRADLNLLDAYVYARAGNGRASRKLLTTALGKADREPVSSAEVAAVYAALGEQDRAFSWLERAVATRDPIVGYLGIDPKFDPLRNDPRFAQMLAKLALNPNINR